MRLRPRPHRNGVEQPRRPCGLYRTPPEQWIRFAVPAIVEQDLFEAVAVGELNEALKDIADVRARRNPSLEVLGVHDARTNLVREVAQLIETELPSRGFTNNISQTIEVAKAAGLGKTLFQTKAGVGNRVVEQSRCLAQELERRVRNRDACLAGRQTNRGSAEPSTTSDNDSMANPDSHHDAMNEPQWGVAGSSASRNVSHGLVKSFRWPVPPTV